MSNQVIERIQEEENQTLKGTAAAAHIESKARKKEMEPLWESHEETEKLEKDGVEEERQHCAIMPYVREEAFRY
jgi:cytidylate kinase